MIVLPVKLILFQLLTLIMTIMIEGGFFHWRLKLTRRQSIELSLGVNLSSYLINWLYGLGLQYLLQQFAYFAEIRFQLMTYSLIGELPDFSLKQAIFFFFCFTISLNFILIVSLEFIIINLVNQLMLTNPEAETASEEPEFWLNLFKTKESKALSTIVLANLSSYGTTIFLFLILLI